MYQFLSSRSGRKILFLRLSVLVFKKKNYLFSSPLNYLKGWINIKMDMSMSMAYVSWKISLLPYFYLFPLTAELSCHVTFYPKWGLALFQNMWHDNLWLWKLWKLFYMKLLSRCKILQSSRIWIWKTITHFGEIWIIAKE